MAEIGKSLVFYLRYFAEMQRLYEEERGAIPGVNPADDPEMRKKIDDIGHAAGIEVRRLLESCISDLRNRLKSENIVKLVSARDATIEKNWEIRFDVQSSKSKKKARMTWIGITVDDKGLTPWVWCRGGLAVEEKIRGCFADGVKSYGSKMYPDWGSGSVGLETIPIPWESAKDFTVEGEGIIKRTQQVCGAIDRDFFKKLISLD
jgi:hypothetical protein